jgi:hypothetical protein
MENQQIPISSNTTLSALAGILFFGPLVKNSIIVPPARGEGGANATEGGLSAQANFILGYCKI